MKTKSDNAPRIGGLRLSTSDVNAYREEVTRTTAKLEAMSPAERLKGLTAKEIVANMSKAQTDGTRRQLLSESERTPAWDQGFAIATARVATVLNSAEAEGRGKAAVKLLTNPALAKMSGQDIVAMLGELPADGSAAMLAAMRAANPNLGTGGRDEFAGGSANNHGWGKAIAKANAQRRGGRAK